MNDWGRAKRRREWAKVFATLNEYDVSTLKNYIANRIHIKEYILGQDYEFRQQGSNYWAPAPCPAFNADTFYRKVPIVKMTHEEIEKELGYKFELKSERPF